MLLLSDFQQYWTLLAKVIQFFVSPEKCKNQRYKFLTPDLQYVNKLYDFLGGVIELKATTSVTLDGKLLAPGNIGYGPRAGGGAGGSVWIDTAEFYGAGNIDVTGGSVGTDADIVAASGNTCKYFYHYLAG